jgi:carboxylesterase
VYGWQRARAARWEADVAARLPVGPDGVVRGAGPMVLDAPGDRGALVLHGFGDTPESVATTARLLHRRGWTVRAPLLAGHGRGLTAFAGSHAEEWLAGVRAAYAELRAERGRVAVVAQSMGGALAAVLAAEVGTALPALVLLAPYLATPADVRWGARLAPLLALGVPYLSSDGGARSMHDPGARRASRNLKVVTPHLVRELARAVGWGRRALSRIAAPTLVVASRQDNRIGPRAMRAAAAEIGRLVPGAAPAELVWLEGCGHVIAADYERGAVARHAADWLERHVPAAPAAAASDPARDA